MKRFLSILLALGLMLSCVSALAETTTATDYSKLPKYTFNWTTYFVTPPTEDAVIIKKIEDTFNVDINMLDIEDGNFIEVLNTYIMGGDTPDVIRLKDPGLFTTYVSEGTLGVIPMDVLREHAPKICAAIDSYKDGEFWSYGVVDGQQYGIPAISAGNQFHLPIVYNQTWMENVGVTETPKTLAEFEDLMRKFTFNDPDGNGKADTYGLSSDGLRVLWGAYGVNPGACDGRTDHSYFQLINGQVEYAATTEQYKEALKVANAWFKEGIIDPEFVTGENTGNYWAISHSLVNHRIGMTVRGNYYHWCMPGQYKEPDVDGNLVDVQPGKVAAEFVAVNPTEKLVLGDTVEGPYGQGVKSWNMLSQFYVFSPEVCNDPDKFARICDIMEYMDRQYSAENEVKEAWYKDIYGEEGDLWYWKDKEYNDAYTNTKFDELYSEFNGVNEYGPTQWGPEIPTVQTSRGAQWAYSLNYDKNGIVNLVQFSLPAMAEYQTGLTNLKDTWMVDFIKGNKDVDKDWQAYLDEMNASGLESMVKEVREWYATTQK